MQLVIFSKICLFTTLITSGNFGLYRSLSSCRNIDFPVSSLSQDFFSPDVEIINILRILITGERPWPRLERLALISWVYRINVENIAPVRHILLSPRRLVLIAFKQPFRTLVGAPNLPSLTAANIALHQTMT